MRPAPCANADANARAMSSSLTTKTDGSLFASSASSAGDRLQPAGAFTFAGDDHLAGVAAVAGHIEVGAGISWRETQSPRFGMQ
jgi:hypothetical protein